MNWMDYKTMFPSGSRLHNSYSKKCCLSSFVWFFLSYSLGLRTNSISLFYIWILLEKKNIVKKYYIFKIKNKTNKLKIIVIIKERNLWKNIFNFVNKTLNPKS